MPIEQAQQLMTIPDYHFIHYPNGEIEVCKLIETQSWMDTKWEVGR